MKAFFKSFFKRFHPKPGETWVFSSDKGPWPSTQVKPVTILDVKDGWVRYKIGSLFPDERLKMHLFLYCYEKWEGQ